MAEYQLYYKTAGHPGGGGCTPCSLPLDPPLEVVDPLCPVAFLFVGCIVILKLLYRKKIIIKEMLGKMP